MTDKLADFPMSDPMARGLCPTCSREVKEGDFTSDASRREAALTGMCQQCQDDFFGKEKTAHAPETEHVHDPHEDINEEEMHYMDQSERDRRREPEYYFRYQEPDSHPCPTCHGHGDAVGYDRCPDCHGTGRAHDYVDEHDEHTARTRVVHPSECPSCESTNSLGRYEKGGWRTYECGDCGNVWKSQKARTAAIEEPKQISWIEAAQLNWES